MRQNSTFQNLLGKISREEFFERYWGKEFLFLKGIDRNNYLPISENELNSFFSNSRLSYPYITLFSKGKPLNFEEYRNRKMGINSTIVDIDKVFTLLQKGYSLTVNSLEQMEPNLAEFCHNLSHELKTKIWTNVYITPCERSGFPQHTDHHDVFALQLSGKKTWTIYPEKKDPLQITLEKGDFLYLPKNYPHEAKTGDSHSVHLTLGAEFATYSDLLYQLWKSVRSQSKFAKRLDPNNARLTPTEIENFQKMVMELMQENKLHDFKKSSQSVNVAQGPFTSNKRFHDWLSTEQLSNNQTLCKRKTVNWELKKKGKMIELQFEDKKIPFPIFLEEFLTSLCQEKPFKLKEINSKVGDYEAFKIAKLLLAEKFLEIKK